MIAATGRQADPIEEYVTALAAALHGPARAKARMIDEIRDGLADATTARISEGEPHEAAARGAVREFGTIDDLLPDCQAELTVAQTRHTARLVVITTTALIAYWQLAWIMPDAHSAGLPRIVQLFGANLGVLTGAAALLATTTLATTGVLGRWLPTPRRLPLVVAWTGTVTSVAMGIATITLVAASAFTASWHLMMLGGALAAAAHPILAASARACRLCARLPMSTSALAASHR
jgi:hypothetical protein